MKKEYKKPLIELEEVDTLDNLLEGSKIYKDDPQSPGSAMSRDSRYSTWEENAEE